MKFKETLSTHKEMCNLLGVHSMNQCRRTEGFFVIVFVAIRCRRGQHRAKQRYMHTWLDIHSGIQMGSFFFCKKKTKNHSIETIHLTNSFHSDLRHTKNLLWRFRRFIDGILSTFTFSSNAILFRIQTNSIDHFQIPKYSTFAYSLRKQLIILNANWARNQILRKHIRLSTPSVLNCIEWICERIELKIVRYLVSVVMFCVYKPFMVIKSYTKRKLRMSSSLTSHPISFGFIKCHSANCTMSFVNS